jgi:hypothetical protein
MHFAFHCDYIVMINVFLLFCIMRTINLVEVYFEGPPGGAQNFFDPKNHFNVHKMA